MVVVSPYKDSLILIIFNNTHHHLFKRESQIPRWRDALKSTNNFSPKRMGKTLY